MSSEQLEEVPKLSNCPPEKPKCPNCNSNENVIKIIYGFPSSGLHIVRLKKDATSQWARKFKKSWQKTRENK